MFKQKEYYQLCYSNDKINTGCEKLLEYKHENSNKIYNMSYALKWECVLHRRAFSDRDIRKANNEISFSKSCKTISYSTSYGFTELPVLQIMNSSCRKGLSPKISCNPKTDYTGVKLVSSLSCDSSDVCSDCKLSESKIPQTNFSSAQSSIKSVCSCNKYDSSSTLSKFMIQSCDNSKKIYCKDFGEGKVYTVLNNNSQSASIKFKRLNQSSWNFSKKNIQKSKSKFKRQYSCPNSPFLSGLRRSRSLPPPRLQSLIKSVDDSNRVTRLEQPSPFVRTIYQYLDDEEAFMLECGSADSIQVHSSGLMKLFQDRKSKLKLKSDKVTITRTIQCDTMVTGAFYSGRRVSEDSSCIISTLASISRERKLPSLNYQDELYIQTPIQQLLPQNKKTVSCAKLENLLKNECGMLDPQHHEDESNKCSVSNKLSNYFDILAKNVKPKKGSVIPYISMSCGKPNSISSFSKKEKLPKKLKHATLMFLLQSRKKVSKNIYNGKSIEKEVHSIYDNETKKELLNKNSLHYPNDEQLSNMFLKSKFVLPQPSFNYAKVFKDKQDKVNKCDSTMSNTSLNNTNKIKNNLAEKLDVYNNNINSLNQRLENDVDSFTAKDFLSLSQQKLISDQRSYLQLDKTINEEHDISSIGLIQTDSMNEKAKSNSKKELSKDDLELKKSRAGSFIGKIKKKYMGSRSCDFEYLKGNIDKSSGHPEEKFIHRHGDIRYHSEVIIEEESRVSPLKISGNWKWRKDSKEKDTKSTSLESRLETSKESKFSTILSVFEQDNLPADPTKIKNVQKISNLKQKGLEKKSVVTELKKKVSPSTPKKYSVPSFLSTFSPLRARKHSNNVILQKSAEELDATICAREKELKELKAQQKQNRPVLVDETKPRSVSANGDYKPTIHSKKSMREDGENFELSSQTRSYFQTSESYLKKSVSSPSLLSKSSTPFEQQRSFNYSDSKPSYSHVITESLQQSNSLPNKEDPHDALCENYSDNNLSLKYSLTNATNSNCICKGTLTNFDSRLLNESYQNYLKSPESSTNGRNIFGEVAKKYEGSPITKERIKHLEQSFVPPASIKQKTNVDIIKCSHGQAVPSSKIAMIIPFMKDASKTFDDSKHHSSNSQNVLKRSNTIASGEMGLKRKPSVIWAKVKNMEVTLVVDCDYQKFMQLKIESFEVRRVNTHKDIEELAIDTFIKHLQLLDKDALDLSSQDIKHLQLHSHEIPIGSAFDISNLNIIDNFLPCYLHLNDKFCWSLAAVAYDVLIPKSFLEKYVSLIFSHNNVVFYGPSGTGKSYLARRLSHLVAHRVQKNSLPIIFSNITPEKWQKIIKEISNDTCDKPKVFVLDGFTQSFFNSNIDISDILTLCQIMNPKSFVICTITQGLSDTIPSSWQQSFRWIWLPNHEEPIDCLLQRYLRRKFIQYGNFHLQREFFRIVDWLASVWRHINSIIERFSSSEYTIGPTMFYPCPTDILNAEEWFVDLWNYSVCPYFIQTVRHGIKKYGERANEWTDPLEWILKTYPWSYEKSKLKFTKIRLEDVGYKETSQLSETTLSETERLMGFLRQLELLMNDGELTDLPPFAKTISTFAGGIAEKY